MAKRDYAKEFSEEFKHLDSRFIGVEKYVKQVAAGKFRSLIVNGHPGIGKTHSVTKFLEDYAKGNYTVLQGRVTLLSLYATLYAFKFSFSFKFPFFFFFHLLTSLKNTFWR